MAKRAKRGRACVSLMAMAITLVGCGSTDLADKGRPSGGDPLVLAPSLLSADPAPPPAITNPDAQKAQAFRRIVRDQTSAMAAYRTVLDEQGDLYYAAITAIEEGLRRGAPKASPVLMEHLRRATEAFQQIDLALTQLQSSLTANSPAIRQADALRAPIAATLRGQQDTALDELRRQNGLMKFESKKLIALRRAIAQGLVPPPLPREPILAAENNTNSSDEPSDEPEAITEEAKPERQTPDDPLEVTAQEAGMAAIPPLVIIRFNRPNVVFKAQLSDAMQRAKTRTPEGQIHLVAVAPQRKTGQEQLLAQAQSHQYAQAILRAMQALGMPSENVRITAQISKAATNSEVHIYADE